MTMYIIGTLMMIYGLGGMFNMILPFRSIYFYFVRRIFQWSIIELRKTDLDIRLHKDDKRQYLTFQGGYKFYEVFNIPKRRE
jgi:hypothetical protein